MKRTDTVYEISPDGKAWSECSYEFMEIRIKKVYGDPGLMIANLYDGFVVPTHYGKFRARKSDGKIYLRRGKGKHHIASDEDEHVSRCGSASTDHGFEQVIKVYVSLSLTCTNCVIGRKTR